MKRILILALATVCSVQFADAQKKTTISNPNIDMQAYLRVASEAAGYRESRRLTEDEFIRMSREPGTVILDARSHEKYDTLHIKGAINLSFPDITVESLDRTLPDKDTRILIYCNNNFVGDQKAFPTKMVTASGRTSAGSNSVRGSSRSSSTKAPSAATRRPVSTQAMP